jgi:hypothetical protein
MTNKMYFLMCKLSIAEEEKKKRVNKKVQMKRS